MKKVYIVPHSHWDREWYMPYEQHHMRLIELIDNLIYLFENDPKYKYFNLDGQTIILDDYLQVRPERKEIIARLIHEGKLQIGPFYILQDAFLTTSESNARNMLVGQLETKKWGGNKVKVGYFPDTFGNMGQTPQLLRQIGLDTAMFGRGVKPTGFANAVVDDDKFTSKYSEMNWNGPDGTSILGILFSNWYDNGKEIPVNPQEAKVYWDDKIQKNAKFSSTDNLLFLNGGDHEPVQMNLSKALEVANTLYPDIEFVHANYNEYLEQLKQTLPDNLDEVDGELTSQETNGWTTLANTASSRVPIKQWNVKVSKQLENVAEPLSTMATTLLNKQYPHDELQYAWKLLMQNHPHDSICACSVDDVADEMITRYKKSYEVALYICTESLISLTKQIATAEIPHGENDVPFIVFNTSSSVKTGTILVEIPIEKRQFNPNKDNARSIYEALEKKKTPYYIVKDQFGNGITATIKSVEVKFDYSLPKDSFRKAYIEKVVHVEVMLSDMPAVSWQTLKLVEDSVTKRAKPISAIVKNKKTLENKFLQVSINQNSTLTVRDKETNRIYTNLLRFEDTGDVGNEYVYRKTAKSNPIYSTNFENEVKVITTELYKGELELIIHMKVPKSMDSQLEIEQKERVDYRNRVAQRSLNLEKIDIHTFITLEEDSHQIKFRTELNNKAKDHRLRVSFKTGIETEEHFADSIYEVVKRPNKVSKKWENPENPQHTHAFVNVHNQNGGLTVSNIGLNEYEVSSKGETINVALLRCVGEIGDWGYFPTPGSQCIGSYAAEYAIEFHSGNEEEYLKSLHNAFSLQVPFTSGVTNWHEGCISPDGILLNNKELKTKITAIKEAESKEGIVVRQYNLTDQPIQVENTLFKGNAFSSSIIENVGTKENEQLALRPYEIHTSIWKDM